MLLDLKNIAITVGISLLSRIEAEIYVISYLLLDPGLHLWFLTHPDKRQCLYQSSRVAWHRKNSCSPWNVNCYYIVYKLRYTLFHIYFLFQAAIFDFSLTLTSSCTNVRPTMLFDSKDMWIQLKFHICFICNVRFKRFRFQSAIWFPVELALNCAPGDVAISNGEFSILKNKRSNVEFASKGDLRPLIQIHSMVTKFITFSPKNHLPTFTSSDVIR